LKYLIGKNHQNPYKQSKRKEECIYTQASSGSVKKNFKIKDNFLNLPFKKIEYIHKAINGIGKPKPYINITTKNPSHKQIIVSMSSENIGKFMASLGDHVDNLNYALKGIKSDTIINFILSDH